MKISDLNKDRGPVKKAGGSGGATSAKTVGKAGSPQSSVSGGSKTGVSISGADEIAASMSADSTARAAKVASIKLQVDSGSYNADSQKTAEKIFGNLTDYSFA